ncbi:LuxR C-terminal-related transcriptional regulator [Mycobacterium sp. Y57]|uniref:helix-turn-helix transcriptional regulator n=1 Tax=Mycolicibacterium xanthum TaxID=2796469 RepID=UPI001C865C42|nr:LuxR family transcriptional regulator [Mycolicibacterium xanthum]MBX7431395.1 LuxR C-terminal-related transcriptional regulator [Mycolicibacterium xanthum]
MSSEPGVPDVVSHLLSARAAFERRDWAAARRRLADLDPADLGDDDCAQLAAVACLTGRSNDCIQTLQRAYQIRVDDGAEIAAARCAFWLANVLQTRGETAIAGGWLARMRRILDGVPGDVVERGYLELLTMMRHVGTGDFAAAAECAGRVTDYGQRFDDANLLAVGMSAQGRLTMYLGDVREGVALLDEAMAGVSAGAISPLFAGQVYCLMIEACQEISDFGRAAQWTMALSEWCDEQPGLLMFTGQCAVHRGQIMRIRGRYREALGEFARAVERYRRSSMTAPVGLALGERGDVLRMLGEFEVADEAYRQARESGHEPQPGLALLWLAQERTTAAVNAIRRLLTERRDDVGRSQLLPAAIRILLAAGERDEAARLSVELGQIASRFGSAALTAAAGYATGTVAAACGDLATALPELRSAKHRWAALDVPYEAARCGVALGMALRAVGDQDSASAELSSAQHIFAELGTVPDAREVQELVTRGADVPGGLSEREVEVLALVARGQTNAEVAMTLSLSEKTVARHLSNIFSKLDVPSRTAAAAFAFDHHIV